MLRPSRSTALPKPEGTHVVRSCFPSNVPPVRLNRAGVVAVEIATILPRSSGTTGWSGRQPPAPHGTGLKGANVAITSRDPNCAAEVGRTSRCPKSLSPSTSPPRPNQSAGFQLPPSTPAEVGRNIIWHRCCSPSPRTTGLKSAGVVATNRKRKRTAEMEGIIGRALRQPG